MPRSVLDKHLSETWKLAAHYTAYAHDVLKAPLGPERREKEKELLKKSLDLSRALIRLRGNDQERRKGKALFCRDCAQMADSATPCHKWAKDHPVFKDGKADKQCFKPISKARNPQETRIEPAPEPDGQLVWVSEKPGENWQEAKSPEKTVKINVNGTAYGFKAGQVLFREGRPLFTVIGVCEEGKLWGYGSRAPKVTHIIPADIGKYVALPETCKPNPITEGGYLA